MERLRRYAVVVVYEFTDWSDIVGLERFEVMQILTMAHGPIWPRRMRSTDGSGLPVLALWGRTKTGRGGIVFVRSIPDTTDSQILGARAMTASQQAEYEAWEIQR